MADVPAPAADHVDLRPEVEDVFRVCPGNGRTVRRVVHGELRQSGRVESHAAHRHPGHSPRHDRSETAAQGVPYNEIAARPAALERAISRREVGKRVPELAGWQPTPQDLEIRTTPVLELPGTAECDDADALRTGVGTTGKFVAPTVDVVVRYPDR